MNINTLKFSFGGVTVVFLMVVFALPFVALANFDPAAWAFRDADSETLYALELLLASSNNQGSNIPVRLINQEYVGNEATVITADLGRTGFRHSGLTLTTSDKNFRREVLLESSDDNQTWVPLKISDFIYQNSLAPGTKNTTIDYPEIASRYLRVTIYDRGEKPLIISGALAHHSLTLVAVIATDTPQSMSSTTPLAPRTPFFENPFYLLVGLFILVVGVIGGLAFRLFKQTQV